MGKKEEEGGPVQALEMHWGCPKCGSPEVEQLVTMSGACEGRFRPMTKRKRPRYLHVDALRFTVVEGRRVVVLEMVDESQLVVLLDESSAVVRHVRPAHKELPVYAAGRVLLAEDVKRAARPGDAEETARRW